MRYTKRDVHAAMDHLARAIESAGGDPTGVALRYGNSTYHYENVLVDRHGRSIAGRGLLGETTREAVVGIRALAEGITLGAALATLSTPNDPYTGTAEGLLPPCTTTT